MNRQLIYESGKREKELKCVLRVIGVFIVIANLILQRYLNLVIGIILISLSFYRKEIYINHEAIEFVHKGLFLKHLDTLQISEITDIVIKDKKENTIICLISNFGLQKIIVDKNVSEKIVKYLLKENKKLKLD